MTIIRSEMAATVWQVKVAAGDRVDADDEIVVLESMKMEFAVVAPFAAVVKAVYVAPGDRVNVDDELADLDRLG